MVSVNVSHFFFMNDCREWSDVIMDQKFMCNYPIMLDIEHIDWWLDNDLHKHYNSDLPWQVSSYFWVNCERQKN